MTRPLESRPPSVWAKADKRICRLCRRVVSIVGGKYVVHNVLSKPGGPTPGPCPAAGMNAEGPLITPGELPKLKRIGARTPMPRPPNEPAESAPRVKLRQRERVAVVLDHKAQRLAVMRAIGKRRSHTE